MKLSDLAEMTEGDFLRHILATVTQIEEASIDAGNGISPLFNTRCELAYRIGFVESRDELARRNAA